MDLRQIELFVVAAEEQHFSRAARRANIVQSGLSAAIRTLEEDLGTQLVVRNTRRVELSEAGRIFLPEAYRVLEAVKAAREAVTAAKSGLRGRLSIGAVQSLPPCLDLPLLLQEFRSLHPMVEISVHEAYLEALAAALRESRLDLAFMPIWGVPPSGLMVEVLFSSPMVVIMEAGHRLADRQHGGVTLRELAEEIFVEFSPRWGTRNLVDQIFAIESAVRRIGFEVENFDLLLQFVERGFGLAIVPQSMATKRGLKSLAIIPAHGTTDLPSWELGLFRAKRRGTLSPNPPADEFKTMVENALRPEYDHPRASRGQSDGGD
jgi:DNA-binding transcriptional LysR family regulator